MRQKLFISFIVVAVLATAAFGQTTAFTYQGSLKDGGIAASGNYDFEFLLFDASSAGTQLGSTISQNSVAISNGTFAVTLDFGSQFPGASRFLEIHVRQTGGGSFTVLAPRQQISSAPYSVKSLNADNAVTATNATQLGGVAANQFVVTGDARLSDARPPMAGSANYIQNQSAGPQASSNFNISGNGTANILSATTQYNLGGQRMLSVSGPFSASLTAMASNTFLGENAGVNTTPSGTINDPTGKFNTFTGALTGVANTTGANNSFFGGAAGNANTTGGNNAFFGAQAGYLNTTGYNNAFYGEEAGYSNTTGMTNSFFGGRAGRANTTGVENAFFGYAAGFLNTTGYFNAFVGEEAGTSNTTGFDNSFVGFQAGFGNSTGGNNTLVGNLAGSSNQTGSNDTMIGSNANLGGNNLQNATAIGANALVSQSNSLVLGNNANVGIGTPTPTERLHVVGNGLFTGNVTVNGTLNATLPTGSSSYIQNTTSQQASSNFNISGNGFIGGSVGIGTTTLLAKLTVVDGGSGYGIYVTTIGGTAVAGNSTNSPGVYGQSVNEYGVWGQSGNSYGVFGQSSSTFGIKGAVGNPSINFGETYVGRAAVWGTSGSSVGVFGTSDSNVGVVGVSQSNIGVLGRSITGTAGRFEGNVFVTGTVTQGSDARLKQGISNLGYGLAEVRRLRPVTWRWKDCPDRSTQLGLVAQEVEPIMPELVSTDKDPQQTKGINYIGLVPVTIKAIQEQQAQIEQQSRENAELKATLNSQQMKIKLQSAEISALRKAIRQINPASTVCKRGQLK